jgi:hypothetical protein
LGSLYIEKGVGGQRKQIRSMYIISEYMLKRKREGLIKREIERDRDRDDEKEGGRDIQIERQRIWSVYSSGCVHVKESGRRRKLLVIVRERERGREGERERGRHYLTLPNLT